MRNLDKDDFSLENGILAIAKCNFKKINNKK